MKRSPNQNQPPKNLSRLLRNGEQLNREERAAVQDFIDTLDETDRYQVMESSIAVGQGGLRIQAVRAWRGLDELTTRLYKRLHIIGAEEEQGDSGGRRWWNILARLVLGVIVLALWGPVVVVVESAMIVLAWRPIARARREASSGFQGAVNAIGRALDNEVIRSKRRLYLRSGKVYRQLVGVTCFLLLAICMALEAQVELALIPAAQRPGWGVLYSVVGLAYLGLVGVLVVDTWQKFATPGMRRAVATAGRVLRVAAWPIKADLDRAVRQDGFEPESPEGRLRRIAIVRRILVWGTALNMACALSAPATAVLLVFHPVVWAIYLFDAKRERRELVAG